MRRLRLALSAWSALVGLAGLLVLASGPACDPDDGGPDEPSKSWAFVYEDLPSALLSVWGSSENDIFFAGSDPKDGDGPWVLHWDGSAMTRIATGQSGTLWWVSGTSATGDVYFAGEGGLALRYARGAGAFTKLGGVPEGVTLFGIQPIGDTVWAVGHDVRPNIGRVYTLEGDSFVERTDLPEGAGVGGAFFKVWGRSDDDLWIVGLGENALHKTASGWDKFPTAFEGRLFTVHGNATSTFAVGGFINAVVLELKDDGPVNVTPANAPQLNGVWVEPGGRVVSVGTTGAVWQRAVDGNWSEVTVPETLLDYHGVYVDPKGDVWAVGGFVLSEPLRQGMMLHYGAAITPPVPTLPH